MTTRSPIRISPLVRAVPTVAAAIACWFRADLAGVARGLVVAEAVYWSCRLYLR